MESIAKCSGEKQLLLAHITIDNVINHSARRISGYSKHPNSLRNNRVQVNNWTCPRSSPAKVPDNIRVHLRAWLTGWPATNQLELRDILAWAIHPGGPKILQACQEALEIDDDTLQPSRSVLADFGNMSSPTVLFILDRLRHHRENLPCVTLGFGPGLTVEAALIR